MRLAVVALLAVACGNSKPSNQQPLPSKEDAAATAEHAPYPFTAEQIHTACPVGRVIPFKIELQGQRPKVHVLEFVASDADGAEIESSDRDDHGKPVGEVKRTRAKWTELQKHAEFPRAATTIEDGVADTPAGKFPSKIYKVKSGDELSTYYFAADRPGPPVLFFTEKAGERVMTSTMLPAVPRAEAATPAPVSCTTDDDCWLDGTRPIARPASMKGKKLRPCKDAERIPVCKDKVCAAEGYKC